MLCVYSHLIIFHELYGFGVSKKIWHSGTDSVVRFDSFETEYHKPESGYCRIRVKSTITVKYTCMRLVLF